MSAFLSSLNGNNSLLGQLLPASFRGVSFYCAESTVDSGRKQVTHEFPNSDRRFVEDLGRLQNIYKMKAIIGGKDYLNARNALQSALEQPGIGLLVHPFFGNINVVAKPYTLSENITTLGEAIFQLTFERSEENIYPVGSVTNLSRIFSFSETALGGLVGDIAKGFSLINNFPNNFLDAQSLVQNIASAFGINTSVYTQARAALDSFKSLLGRYEDNTNNAIANPSVLGENTMGLYKGMDDLITDPTDRLDAYSRFYDFYDNKEVTPPTTFERIQRQNNRDVMAGSIQGGALVQSYKTASQIDFDNIRELNTTQDLLEKQYQKIINNRSISDNTKSLIQNLRTETRKFFEAERLNVNNITTISTARQPLRVLTYQYYGDTENVTRIARLNSIYENGFVEGDVDILTS